MNYDLSFTLFIICISFGLGRISNFANRNSLLNVKWQKKSKRILNSAAHKIISIRGGLTAVDSNTTFNQIEEPNLIGNATCIITTSLGSSFLDKTKKISIQRNSSVSQLKALIHDKFPGSPPVVLQKLFYGFRSLNNTEIIGNITNSNQISILLDMISGTGGYNKTMSISQAIEAYVSVIVHQTYLSSTMKKVFDHKDHVLDSSSSTSNEDNNNNHIETLSYRDMFDMLNQSFYDQHQEEILAALEKEKEPDLITADTLAWRKQHLDSALEDDNDDRNPLVTAWAKQFDTNKQVALALIYYSIVLVVFSKYATQKQGSKSFLLIMVPLLWLSKLRQFRLASKVGLCLFLQIAPYIDFIMPLLPAPYQVSLITSYNNL